MSKASEHVCKMAAIAAAKPKFKCIDITAEVTDLGGVRLNLMSGTVHLDAQEFLALCRWGVEVFE